MPEDHTMLLKIHLTQKGVIGIFFKCHVIKQILFFTDQHTLTVFQIDLTEMTKIMLRQP